MKPRVKFCFEDSDNSQKINFELCEVEQIDAIIEGLEDARAELEHQIEMEKQRKRDKRKRAKMRRKFEHENISQEATDAINARLKHWFDKQEEIKNTFVNQSDINEKSFWDEEIKIDDVLRKSIFNGFMKELKEIEKINMPKKEEIEEAFEEIKQTFDKIDDKDNFKKLLKPYVELAEALIKMDK